MKNARQPGNRINALVRMASAKVPKNCSCAKIWNGPSKMSDRMPRVTAMSGQSQNSVAIGFIMPIDFLSSSSCVSDQRRPPHADADSTAIIPKRSNCVSALTIMITPAVMMAMIPTSFHVGFSRWKRKAKRSTKPSEDDLHMAAMSAGAILPCAL